MHFVQKTILMSVSFSVLSLSGIDAYCSKCAKIESDRLKEQKEHPQKWEYYDRQAKSNLNGPNPNDKPHSEANKFVKSNFLAAHEDSQKTQNDFFEENDIPYGKKPSPSNTPSSSIDSFPNETKVSQDDLKIDLDKSYSTIFVILKTKDFIETLNGPFTLFIPSNESFEKLPPGTLQALNLPENSEKLAALVSNHVVARKILKNDFVQNRNKEIKAISGKNLTLNSINGKLFIDGVQILKMEPAGDNGVIYVINKVLL